MSVRLYLARHGETQWNREGRYQGRRESALTKLGEAQAAALATALASSGARRVVSSPLERCRATAAPLARALDLPLELNPDLVEIAHGTWEGRLRDDVQRDDAARLAAWRATPDRVRFEGGESLDDVRLRWERFVGSLDVAGADAVAVTHDVLVRLAIVTAAGRPLGALWEARAVNGGYAELTLDANGLHLERECVDAHLTGIMADAALQAL